MHPETSVMKIEFGGLLDGLAQSRAFGLSRLARADIADCAEHQALAELPGMYLQLDDRAVGTTHSPFEDHRNARVERRLYERYAGQVPGIDVAGPDRIPQLLDGTPQELGHRRIDVHDPTVHVQEQDSVGGLLDQVSVASLAGPQRLLGFAPSCCVEDRGDQMRLAVQLERLGRKKGVVGPAVSPDDLDLEILDPAVFSNRRGHTVSVQRVREQQQLLGRPADHLLAGVAGPLKKGVVDVHYAAIAQSRDGHHHAGEVEGGLEPGVAGSPGAVASAVGPAAGTCGGTGADAGAPTVPLLRWIHAADLLQSDGS